MKSRTEILVPLAAIQAVPIAVIVWYRLHRYAWYRYSAIVTFFLDRFEEIYSRMNMKDLEDSIEWIGYAANDMDNVISEIDYNDPMTLFDIEKSMGKVIN